MDVKFGNVGQLGETHQSTQVNSADQNIKEDVQKKVKESEVSYDAVSSQGDTLCISERGKAASAKMANSQEETVDSVDGKVIKKPVNVEQPEEEPQTNDLSGYTKMELQQMYLDGDITKAEYDEELDSRETEASLP